MLTNSKLLHEIHEWDKTNKDEYDMYLEPLDNFWGQVERFGAVVLPSGKATYIDLQYEADEAIGVFELEGQKYAFKGTYNSWGSGFDYGPYPVESREVTVTKWFALN